MFLTVPPPMPGDICIEVLWELAHSPVLNEEERERLIDRIVPLCRDNLVPPPEVHRAPEILSVFHSL